MWPWLTYLGEENAPALVLKVHALLGDAVADNMIHVAGQLTKLVGVGVVRIALELVSAGLDVAEIENSHHEVKPAAKPGFTESQCQF